MCCSYVWRFSLWHQSNIIELCVFINTNWWCQYLSRAGGIILFTSCWLLINIHQWQARRWAIYPSVFYSVSLYPEVTGMNPADYEQNHCRPWTGLKSFTGPSQWANHVTQIHTSWALFFGRGTKEIANVSVWTVKEICSIQRKLEPREQAILLATRHDC